MRAVPLLLLCVFLSACSSSRYHMSQDRAPDVNFDVSTIPEPVPRYEPFSRGGNMSSYRVFGRQYHVLNSREGFVEEGMASWYGAKFHGHKTSNGETYNMYAFSAAHKHLPLPSFVRVTNLENGRSLIVRVNDRGPFHGDRIIDLSYAAAKRLDMLKQGTARVRVENVTPPAPGQAVPAVVPMSTTLAPGHYLQVGAYGSEPAASRVRDQVAALVETSVLINPVDRSAGRVYRVRVGPFESIEQAQEIRQRLTRSGQFTGTILLPAS